MFDTTDILVYRQPVIGALIQHAIGLVRTGIACVVPGRLEEGIKGIGFTFGRAVTFRAGGLDKRGHLLQRRTGRVHSDIGGQDHRQVGFRYRHRAALVTIYDRNRATPVTLARHAPVTQPVIHLAPALAGLLQPVTDGGKGLL